MGNEYSLPLQMLMIISEPLELPPFAKFIFVLIFWAWLIWAIYKLYKWVMSDHAKGFESEAVDKGSDVDLESPEYLSEDIKDNWEIVFSNDDFVAYWDGLFDSGDAVKIYSKPDMFLEDEIWDFEHDAESVRRAVVGWYDNIYGYPYKFDVSDKVYVIWDGRPWITFHDSETDEVIYKWSDPSLDQSEGPSTREDAENIAELEIENGQLEKYGLTKK